MPKVLVVTNSYRVVESDNNDLIIEEKEIDAMNEIAWLNCGTLSHTCMDTSTLKKFIAELLAKLVSDNEEKVEAPKIKKVEAPKIKKGGKRKVGIGTLPIGTVVEHNRKKFVIIDLETHNVTETEGDIYLMDLNDFTVNWFTEHVKVKELGKIFRSSLINA